MIDDQPTSVYLYRDSAGMLLYVGITARSIARNGEHNKTKEWWEFTTSQDVEHFPTRKDALARETRLINDHSPPFNVQGNPHHADMRAAYLLARSIRPEPRSPEQVFKETSGILPITKYAIADGVCVFRADPEHYSLASILQIRPAHPPSIYLGDHKIGSVRTIKPAGAFVWFRVSVRKWVIFDYGGYVKVKRVKPSHPELGFRLSHLRINKRPTEQQPQTTDGA